MGRLKSPGTQYTWRTPSSSSLHPRYSPADRYLSPLPMLRLRWVPSCCTMVAYACMGVKEST
jgi:hypothetical protein